MLPFVIIHFVYLSIACLPTKSAYYEESFEYTFPEGKQCDHY
jgi:hypothetical protein